MAIHYMFETSDMDLCLECSTLIAGAEAGCVAYTETGLETLAVQGISEQLCAMFFTAYQLQHFEHYGLSDETTVAALAKIGHFIQTNDVVPDVAETKIAAFLEGTFFYKRPALATVGLAQVLASANTEQPQLLKQYINDIWHAYSEYHQALRELV